ncbi:hypothetical protein AVEN_206757-1 [Araneus ventricosus]|uniref:Uncharacterized protein n=1 Tax=Araneus ventricosus TaxID=182803 RepID=A0A4Y2C6B9_ARAVE|nr:hypothetical protein AVEN_206757-1 [Araneus ventricosus]
MIQCDHPSLGPHIASCAKHSPCPFSPDLTSCDVFRWDCLKSEVYLSEVPTLTTLKDILLAVLSIHGDILLSTVKNRTVIVYRMQCVVYEKGGPIKRGLVLCCSVISSM